MRTFLITGKLLLTPPPPPSSSPNKYKNGERQSMHTTITHSRTQTDKHTHARAHTRTHTHARALSATSNRYHTCLLARKSSGSKKRPPLSMVLPKSSSTCRTDKNSPRAPSRLLSHSQHTQHHHTILSSESRIN